MSFLKIFLDQAGKWTGIMLSHLGLFPLDAQAIDKNLKKKISLSEFFVLMFAFSMIGVSIWTHTLWNEIPYDYENFIEAVSGDFSEFYYGFWILPLISLFAHLPVNLGYFLWAVLNILGVWFASRVFCGNTVLVLLSYQMFYVIFYGQISGLIIGMVALVYWGIIHEKWHIAGIGFLIAASKYQTGLVMAGLLLLLINISWQEKLKILVIPSIGGVLSLVIYPNWFLLELERMRLTPPNDWGNISLWNWMGPLSLLLFLPLLSLPMDWRRRFLAASAACALGLPYFQQADLISLLVFPFGWLPLLGNLGFIYYWIQWDALKLLIVVPIMLYLLIVIPSTFRLIKSR